MSRTIVAALILGAGGVVGAQTPVAVQMSAESMHQVRVFETNLRTAVARAAGQLADRARDVVPGIELTFQSEPKAYGTILPEGEGLVFLVEVPGIEPGGVWIWDQMYKRLAERPDPVTPVTNGRPPDRVVAEGAPKAEGMMTNPTEEYSEFTRKALVDAMLDNAFALPLKEGQTLTVIVVDGSILPVNALQQPPRKLTLRLNGDDLLALRQNRIDRDEAKKRIREFRY
jgi:hypothetical protein